MTGFHIVRYISAISVILPLIALIKNHRFLTGELKFVGYLVCVAVIGELTGGLQTIFGINNMPSLHAYAVLEFAAIALIYYHYFKSKKIRAVIVSLIIAFSVFSILNIILFQRHTEFNTYPRTLEALLIIMIALFYLFHLSRKLQDIALEHDPMFWVNGGIFFYFTGTVLLFMMSNYMMDREPEMHFKVWSVMHSALNITFNAAIAVGLWVAPKTYRQTP